MSYQKRDTIAQDLTSQSLEAIEDCTHGDWHLPDTLPNFEQVWEHTPERLKMSREGRRWITRPESFEIEKGISFDLLRIGLENICITTGGPGSGKSTALIRDYLSLPGLVMAPSGVAAQRLRKEMRVEASKLGMTAPNPQTIHSAMQIPVVGAPKWSDKNGKSNGKKRSDAYYIDEASMIDTDLFALLLRRIKKGAKIFLYGDPDQLPPVGWGSPFLSLCGRVGKHRHLEGNHRTKTNLNESIESIKKGEWPTTSSSWTEEVVAGDFGVGCRRAAMRAKEKGGQILCPWRASAQISGRILASLDRSKSKADFSSFLPGDEIVACHSIHQASVTNGVRYIFRGKDAHGGWRLMDMDSGSTFGISGRLVKKAATYSISDIKDPSEWETSTCFLFAGGLTIHKSQGSQYDNVILLIHDSANAEFYKRAMLYVAASRARQSVHVVWCCPPDRVEYLRNSLLKCGHDYMSNIPEVVKREKIRARLREFTEKSKNNKKKY